MSLIIAENITHLFGAQEILKNVSLTVSESDRIGLVGPNGEGKTTLLRILAGFLPPISGSVHSARGLSIGYLPQDPPAVTKTTLHQSMLDAFAPLLRMESDLHGLADRLASSPDDSGLLDRYGRMQTRFEALGGYSYPNRIEQVLTGLAFPPSMYDRPLAKLSGGERTRACLATLLLKAPGVLLLDEPTNHLDIDSVEWLENWLSSFKGALVVVSHDRYLLDQVASKIWEVSAAAVESYRGNYSAFLTQRAERLKERNRTWRSQQVYVEETQDFIRRHLAGQRTKEAQGRRTRLERFLRDEAIPKPRENPTIHLSFPPCRRSGDVVMETTELELGFPGVPPIASTPALHVERGMRIAVVGPNGSGKTTLLRTLLSELPPLSGSVRFGANVELGYQSQTHTALDPSINALDSLMAASASSMKSQAARSLLGSFLLSGDDVYKHTRNLSGGERSRLVLACLIVQKANLLVLDEPTNHLDVPSTEILQDALLRFEGTIIFVTHDRYLVEAVATHVWAIRNTCLHRIVGSWEEYLEWRSEFRETAPSSPGDSSTVSKKARRVERALLRKEQNRLQRLKRRHLDLESEIHAAETDLKRLSEEMSSSSQAGHLDSVHDIARLYNETDSRLKTLWTEWEAVGEKLE